MNVLDAAYAVLRDAGEPLHYRTLTDRILERDLWHTSGKTPWETINASLSVDIKERDVSSRFQRAAPGIYTLREGFTAQSPHSLAARTAAATRAARAMSFLDAAEQVLRTAEPRGPMHYVEITRQAIDQGLIAPEGLTPATSMSAMIGTDIRRRRSRTEPPRFVRRGGGMVGLAEPAPPGLAAEIEKHNREVRNGLLARLGEGSPEEFEIRVEELLTALGFEEVKRTPLSGDGGVDVRGTLVVGDVVRIRMAVQAKRWKNNVPPSVVQQVRGSLGAHEQGLIITTSDFSPGARAEAARSDASPVALMNGEQLATLLAANEIGVHRAEHELLSLDEAPDASQSED